eukprot:235512_1
MGGAYTRCIYGGLNTKGAKCVIHPQELSAERNHKSIHYHFGITFAIFEDKIIYDGCLDCECYVGCNYCQGLLLFDDLQHIQIEFYGRNNNRMTLLGKAGTLQIQLSPVSNSEFDITYKYYKAYTENKDIENKVNT